MFYGMEEEQTYRAVETAIKEKLHAREKDQCCLSERFSGISFTRRVFVLLEVIVNSMLPTISPCHGLVSASLHSEISTMTVLMNKLMSIASDFLYGQAH